MEIINISKVLEIYYYVWIRFVTLSLSLFSTVLEEIWKNVMVHFFRKPHFLDKNISCKTSEHHIYCFLTLFFHISAILPRFIFRGMYFQENKFTTRIWFSHSQKPTKLTKPYQKPRKLHYYIKRTDSNSPHNTAFSKINIHKYHFWTVFLFWIHLLHLDQTQVFKFLLMSSDDFLLLLFSSKVRSQVWLMQFVCFFFNSYIV